MACGVVEMLCLLLDAPGQITVVGILNLLQDALGSNAFIQAVGIRTGSQRSGVVAHIAAGGRVSAVGFQMTPEAPLTKADVLVQSGFGRSPLAAKTIEGLHQRRCMSNAERTLKAAQRTFAESLLVEECGNTVSVELLIVAGEVLNTSQNALGLHTFNFRNRSQIVHDAALGHVLIITSAKGSAVQIGADAPDLHLTAPESLLAHQLAAALVQVLIPSSCQSAFIGVAAGREVLDTIVCVRELAHAAVNAVAYRGGGQNDRGNCLSAAGAGQRRSHLFQRHLVQIFIPRRIVIPVNITHVDQRNALVVAKVLGHVFCTGSIVGLYVGITAELLDHILRSFHGGLCNGISALPILPGQIGACAIDPIVQITVIEPVRNLNTGTGYTVAVFIHCVLRPVIGLICVAGCFIAVGIYHVGCTLSSQNVVQCIMSVVADGKVVITGAQDVALGVHIVVACQQITVDGDLDLLGLAGLEQVGFGETCQLHSGFFDLVLLLVVAVGGLCVQLNNRLACHTAGVFHGDGCAVFIVYSVVLHGIQRLLKAGVGQAITKRIGHFILIDPLGRTIGGTIAAAGIALTENGILVAGLIVFVTNVDILGLEDHIVGIFIFADLCADGRSVLIHRGLGAGVHAGGGGQRAGCVGVDQMA